MTTPAGNRRPAEPAVNARAGTALFVGDVTRQDRGLLHPAFPGNPAREVEVMIDPGNVFRRPGGNLVIVEDTEFVQHFLYFRADPANDGEVVRRAVAPGGPFRPDRDLLAK